MNAQEIFRFLFNFNGRMARRPFWIAYVINRIIYYSLAILLINTIVDDRSSFYMDNIQHPTTGLIILIAILIVILLINGWSLISRRLHDTGRSFWVFFSACLIASLCSLIPFLGSIISLGFSVYIFVLFCLPTDIDDETYGPVPQQQAVTERSQPDALEETEEYDYTQLNGIQLEPYDGEDWVSFGNNDEVAMQCIENE